jgi:hypothetical protein
MKTHRGAALSDDEADDEADSSSSGRAMYAGRLLPLKSVARPHSIASNLSVKDLTPNYKAKVFLLRCTGAF